MPSKIDQNLLPPVIRESIDPDILNRAQSIEWSINRDTGEDEHGYLDGTHEDYLSSQNLMHKTHPQQLGDSTTRSFNKAKRIEWADNVVHGRDSGFDYTPTSPSLGGTIESSRLDLSPLDDIDTSGNNVIYNNNNNNGSMKRHPQGQYPFPIYKVNQEQLQGDVVFEVAPRAKPGERTVHYEKSTRVLNEQELNALGLDPNFFPANSRTMMDEQEEELIETSVLKGGAKELDDIYRSMRTDASDYFEQRQRARSASPDGSRRMISDEDGEQYNSEHKKTVIFGSVDEINNREQEFYPYRDAHNGKPLPGDNEYGTWGSRYDDQKQWKLCNGQWVRVAEPKPKPKVEKYLAERVKCKPPKKVEVAKTEPVRKVKPQGSKTDSDSDTDSDNDDFNEQPRSRSSSPLELVDRDSFSPLIEPLDRVRRNRPLDLEKPIDIDALRDRYRPKVAEEPVAKKSNDDDNNKKLDTKPLTKIDDDNDHDNDDNEPKTGTILLEPIRPPTPPMEEIVVEPIQPTYVEIKKPLKEPEGEEEKLMEDPNLMWMRMGPAQYGPPFGSLRKRKGREEEWVGPPCELCHKQIEERRCMLAENMKFHCWHFACSFCLKTLKPADFLIAEADKKPYCLNCHKREFPEISLVNLNLEAE